jgi:hypothetical protein
MGAGSFLGVKWPGMVLTTHPLPAPRLGKSRAIPLLPLKALEACYRASFTFPHCCSNSTKIPGYTTVIYRRLPHCCSNSTKIPGYTTVVYRRLPHCCSNSTKRKKVVLMLCEQTKEATNIFTKKFTLIQKKYNEIQKLVVTINIILVLKMIRPLKSQLLYTLHKLHNLGSGIFVTKTSAVITSAR